MILRSRKPDATDAASSNELMVTAQQKRFSRGKTRFARVQTVNGVSMLYAKRTLIRGARIVLEADLRYVLVAEIVSACPLYYGCSILT